MAELKDRLPETNLNPKETVYDVPLKKKKEKKSERVISSRDEIVVSIHYLATD